MWFLGKAVEICSIFKILVFQNHFNINKRDQKGEEAKVVWGIRVGRRGTGQGWKGLEQPTSIRPCPGIRAPSCSCENNQ